MTQDVRSDPGGLEPGEQLAGYLIQEEIGRGGMAVVYRSLDLRLDRLVALKVLAPHLGEDEAFRQRFMRESRAAAGVDHPHIIPVFEAGEAGGVLFIAMRYVSRGDVRWLLRNEGRLTATRTLPIVGQIASALDAAHAYGLVHRDVKPGNILLGQASDESDHAYLSDFGLSKHSLNTATLTAAGQFLGTLDYVSPEQIQGQPVDGRADQYALACTVVEMLTGAPPFRADDSMALMWAQLETEPPRLTQLRPDLPPAVDQVIGAAMAKSPGGRFPSCRDFALALSAACLQIPGPQQTGLSARAAESREAGEPHAPGEPRQAGQTRNSGEPLQYQAPHPQDERPGWEAAVAGDAAGRQENRRQENRRQENRRQENRRQESWRQDRWRQDRWQPAPSPNGDAPRPGAGLPGTPPAAGATPPAGGATPPAAGAARPAPGARPLAATPPGSPPPGSTPPGVTPLGVTRWDGRVPGDIDRPHSAGPDRRPVPGHSGGVRSDTRPHQVGGAVSGRGALAGPFAGQRGGAVQRSGAVQGRGRLADRGRRGRSIALVAVIAVACAALIGGIAYKLADRHGPTSPPAAGSSTGVAAQANPAATVRAYFAAINEHRYLRAWHLVGERGSYTTFAAGFAGTAHDTVKILSVKGDVVTATLAAEQQNGSTKTFSGTYIVTNGVIVGSDVRELS